MKKCVSLLVVAFTLCFLFASSQNNAAHAEYTGGIAVDSEHFPDEAFRRIVTKFDQDADGLLNRVELEAVTEINLFWTSVESLQGIECFPNLTSLNCSGKHIAPINVTCFSNLRVLNCSFNDWEHLDLSGCTSLEELQCEGNRLQALKVTGCRNLRVLNCQGNNLIELDVSGCTALKELDCSSNSIYRLVLNGCSSLSTLNCSANCLTALEVSQASNLRQICCNFNFIQELNVTGCPSLVTLDCIGNSISQLILGTSHNLKNLFCGCNALTALDVSGCPNLKIVNCCYNQLENLDISACPLLLDVVSTAGSIQYRISPSVVTYSNGYIDTSYEYSLDYDAEVKLTLDTKVHLIPNLYRPIPESVCPLISSDPEEWGMPSVALDYWHILSVRAQGSERLNYLNTFASNDYPNRYSLYDIDKDGIPELIVEGSGGEANRLGYIFTEKNGHAIYVGAIHMGHTSLCTFPGANGILCYNGHMGSMNISKISLKDGQLEREEVIPETDGFASSDDYPVISSLVPGSAILTYNCKVTDPILFRVWKVAINWLETGEEYISPNGSWPEGNERFYSSIINSNQFVTLRGNTVRENYTPYVSFSSLLDYNVRTYSGQYSISHYDLIPRSIMYDDFDKDGTIDCLLLISDTNGKVSIPLVLSYNDHTVYAYIQEDLASQVINVRVNENGSLEYELKTYSQASSVWIPVKLCFYKDCFLFMQGSAC